MAACPLYYRGKDGGRLEMEFVIEGAHGVIPVEVKAKTGQTLSLDKLLARLRGEFSRCEQGLILA